MNTKQDGGARVNSNTYHINVKNLHPFNHQNSGFSQPLTSSGLGHNQIPKLYP